MIPWRRTGLLLLLTALALGGWRPAAAMTELVAGSLAEISWEEAPPGAEEWEAFLSVDGGRTYPFRVTPHLDLGIRRFAFQVPDFPTRDARLLLRFGNERREVEVERPERFAILPGGWSHALPAASALARGERPRPADPGVVVWVEGGRDGSRLREVAVEGRVLVLRSIGAGRGMPWLLLLGPPPASGAAMLAVPVEDFAAFNVAAAPLDGSPPPRPSRSVRLLTHRFNE